MTEAAASAAPAGDAAADADAAAARRRNIENLYPLAPLQEGILFHSLTTPENAGVYVPQMAYHLRGAIDGARLREAWEATLARHSTLRSAIHWEERDEPFQVVYRSLPLPWEALDWRGEDAEARLRALFDANRARPFDLRRPPLLRLQFARTGEESSILVLCFHHIILDGWSTARMLQDVMAIYRGGPEALPPARPYAEYVRWLRGRDRAASGAFWRDYLAGSPGPSVVFGDPGAAPDFARSEWPIPEPLAARIGAFCAERGVTLNTLLQGVLGLCLAEALGRTDVIFGGATAGRPASLPGATAMVGLFLNALPVRVRLDLAEPVAAWLRRLQARQAETIEHEHVALREIQAGRGTLFDCLLVIENYPVTVGDGGDGIALDRVEFDEWTHFPLTLLVAPAHAGMRLILRRDRSVVSDAALEAFLSRFAGSLEAVVARPDEPVGALVGPLAEAAPAKPRPIAPPSPAIAAIAGRSPETEAERAVAAIWAEVLKGRAPAAGDNFFALGGHSLLAAKVVARIRREFGVEAPVRALFDRPVLADFAAFVDALRVAAGPVEGETVVEF